MSCRVHLMLIIPNYHIESVDSMSISRDGPDMYIYVIHYKTQNISEQGNFQDF